MDALGDGVDEGHLVVPIDYANPDAGTFTLYLARHRATGDRVGSLLVNPGGPGGGGSDFAIYADQVYEQPLLDAFDIIGWDPRGTGLSTPAIDCIDDYDHYFTGVDITPDDQAERDEIVDLSKDFTDQCVQKNPDILEFVGTNNSARDMDSIRKALGEDTISYFGFSYGSELGATWATLFPDTVRAAVLDGAVDPNADDLQELIDQNVGFENALSTFLAQCSADPECAFHSDGNAEDAFDQLMLKLDAKPMPTTPGRPDLTRAMAILATANAMYNDASWPTLAQALAAAEDGDANQLLALFDDYYGRNSDGTWSNDLEAFVVIDCMDSTERPTVAEDDATAAELTAVAPRLSPGTTGGYMCTFFPPSPDPRVTITGAGAGPIVVCGATGDPATPLNSTRRMASTLEDGRLVVIVADQHTCYGVSDCADEIINDYLVNLDVPPHETDCAAAPDTTGDTTGDTTVGTTGDTTVDTTVG